MPSPFNKLEAQKVNQTKPKADITVMSKTSSPVAQQKVFDANDASTWPVCASDEIVRADNGQCSKKPAETASVAQAASTPTTTQTVSYSGDKTSIMDAAGIAAADRAAVDYIISHESGWRWWVVNNEGSGATGLCQALPGNKMASAGADWATNPVTQLKWCSGYALGRYGSWWSAYSFWVSNKWW